MAPEMAALPPDLVGRMRERADIIKDNAAEGTDAISLLRDITQELPFDPQRIDLAAVISGCVAEMRASCDEHKILLRVEGCATPALLYADPGLARYVIRCVLANARDAVLERRRLHGAAQWEQTAGWTANIIASLYVDPTLSEASVAVLDTGTGIAPDNLKRIFQPLFSTKKRENGSSNSGIGLFTVNRIMALHQGRVDVKSEWGVGAEFKLTFPCSAAARESLVASV
jgi:signal transduction histidine kinase